MGNVRTAWNRLRRAPSLWLLLLLLGSAAAAASVVGGFAYVMVVRPLPTRTAERVVALGGLAVGDGMLDPIAWWGRAQGLQSLAVFHVGDALLETRGEKRWVRAAEVSDGFFPALSAPVVQGRSFTDTDHSSRSRVALISERLSYVLTGQGSTIGSEVQLGGRAYTVVGVVPAWLSYPAGTTIWVPGDHQAGAGFDYVLGAEGLPAIRRNIGFVGLISERASIEVVREQLLALLETANRELSPRTGLRYGDTVTVTRLRDALGARTAQTLNSLFAASAFVWLLASTNLALALMTKVGNRRRELAIRRALGARRGSLLGEALSELALMILAASSASALLAYGMLKASLHSAQSNGVFVPVSPNEVLVIASAGLLALATTIGVGMFAWLPLLLGGEDYRLRERLSHRPSMTRWGRNCLVAIQVAAALFLVSGALVLLRGMLAVTQVDHGFPLERMAVAELTVPPAVTVETFAAWRSTVLSDLATTFSRAAVSSATPLFKSEHRFLEVTADGSRVLAAVTQFEGDLLGVYEMALLSGQAGRFDPTGVAINQQLANALFGVKSPIGRTLMISGEPRPLRVAAVVEDLRALDDDATPAPQLYREFTRLTKAAVKPGPVFVSVSCTGGCGRLSETLAAVLRKQTLADVQRSRTIEQLTTATRGPQAFRSSVWATYAIVGLIVALGGVATVTARTVISRAREVQIRLALGATTRRVELEMASEAVVFGLAGIVAGCALSVVVSRIGASAGLPVVGPGALTGTALVIGLLLVVSALIPARSAAQSRLELLAPDADIL